MLHQKISDTLWKKKVVVGVDVGQSALKICQFDATHRNCQVWQVARNSSHNPGQQVEEALQACKGAGLHVALTNSASWSGYLELPKLQPRELEVALPSAISREIPQTLSEVQLYTLAVPPLGDAQQSGFFYMTLPHHLAASCRESLTSRAHPIIQVEPSPLALSRTYARNRPASLKEAMAVVCCGHVFTTLLVLHNGSPYYCRQFRLGGADFTEAFKMGDRLNWAEAERRKFDYCVSENYYQVEPIVKRWLDEIRRSLAYVATLHDCLSPQRLSLSGGSALWSGLAARLQQHLRLPVEVAEWHSIQCEQPETRPAALYETSLGLVS